MHPSQSNAASPTPGHGQQPMGEFQAQLNTSTAGFGGPAPEAPSLSLPKGGGAIQSIGEKFQANAATGTAGFTVPFRMTPSPRGFSPEIALTYNSGQGNGIVGLGWDLGLPSITRKTSKGLPTYRDESEQDTFLLAGAEDLVPYLEENGGNWEPKVHTEGEYQIHRYRPRTEGLFARIERWHHTGTSISHWRITDRSNVTAIYGLRVECRVADPQDATHIFTWLPDLRHDDKGNAIRYHYQAEDKTGVDTTALHERHRSATEGLGNQCLKEILYGNTIMFDPADVESWLSGTDWHFQLVMDYGDHSGDYPTSTPDQSWSVRQDPFSEYRPGFELRQYRLLRRVLMYHHFEADLGPAPYLVGSTELTYQESGEFSLLKAVKHWGYIGDTERAEYPEVTFTYSQAQPSGKVEIAPEEITDDLPTGIDGGQVSFVDLYGEGLPGLLHRGPAAWHYKANLGDANFYRDSALPPTEPGQPTLGTWQTSLEVPAGFNARLADVDGDGAAEAVIEVGNTTGYYDLAAGEHFERAEVFE
ncbi:MAG: SpvB/TcaC N-terminal domain-containing protein, partial [Bacteroidota bacterium]